MTATAKRGRKPKTFEDMTHKEMIQAADRAIDESNETPEQKRTRLLAELASLATTPGAPTVPVGPNYWTMPHGRLKTELITRGILERTGTREAMISALQGEDAKRGLTPCPMEQAQTLDGTQFRTRGKVYPETKNEAATVVRDAEGHVYATFYKITKYVGQLKDQPVFTDMEENAQLCCDALNGGAK